MVIAKKDIEDGNCFKYTMLYYRWLRGEWMAYASALSFILVSIRGPDTRSTRGNSAPNRQMQNFQHQLDQLKAMLEQKNQE